MVTGVNINQHKPGEDRRGEVIKAIEDYFTDWESHVFGYGYGTGEEYTIDALRVFMELTENRYDYRILEQEMGVHTAWLMINILCRADIIEYGSSPRFGWLSAKGERLREFMAGKSRSDLIALTEKDQTYSHCYPDACNCGPEGYDPSLVCQNPFWLDDPTGTNTEHD